MNNKRFLPVFLVLISMFIYFNNNAYSVSVCFKAQIDFKLTLDTIRKVQIMVENFPEGETAKNYDKLKYQFQEASEAFYSRKFRSSYEKYKSLKLGLIQFLETIAKKYIDRADIILKSTSKESFDIMIKFGKNGKYAKYFIKPFDPISGVKPYNKDFKAGEYHLFFKRDAIKSYLNEGYKSLNKAKLLFNDPDIKYLKEKKSKTSHNLNFLIKHYLSIIKLCKTAKQYGIEIHKIRKWHKMGEILAKYNISFQKLISIFDDRIPEEFKVDAIDNENLIYKIEKKRLDKVK